MQQYLPILKRTKIFESLSEHEILSALNCLNASVKTYPKGARIFSEGDTANFIGIIVSGEVETQKSDYNGNINIISKLYASGLVAAVASYSAEKRLPFDVVTVCNSEILCLDTVCLIRPCRNACAFHSKIIENMLSVIADRNMQLSLKIDILTKRTIREKILTYLHSQSKKAKNPTFSIGLTRRQMAEYLSVNRSALSRELCKMQSDGILNFSGNRFNLKQL